VRYDLHLHSIYSDGVLAPQALVERVKAGGAVTVMALTDHDCTDGIAEASRAAEALGLGFVPGVEVSVTWEGMTLHVVGLRVDPACVALQQGLTGLMQQRHERARRIGEKLARRRIDNAYEGAKSLAGGAIVGRAHFARFLVREGYVPSLGQAFKQYLVRGGDAYVAVDWAPLADAVSWIRAAGGQAVLAHPARYKLTAGKMRKLLTEFKSCGGAGIEVVSCGQTRDVTEHLTALAQAHGLLASCGSDFHGPEQTWIEPGRFGEIPVPGIPIWHDWPRYTPGGV
jgi:predicted metal-dependent phosphoesterase TrpH